jgi:MFS family permease
MPTWLPPSLQHAQFRYLWVGLLISITGSQMQNAAILWHVNELSGQPIALGAVGLVRILPILLFSLIAGAIADRLNRRKLMFLTQGFLAILALTLGMLTLLGVDSLPLIYAIIALSAAAASFDLPARQSLVPNLVPRDTLTNAFSLSSIAMQTGSIAGPAIGGIVLGQWGIQYAYFLNAFSYMAVIAALILMGPIPQDTDVPSPEFTRRWKVKSFTASVREGLGFVRNQPIILSSMLLDFFATFFSNAITLLPIFAKEILNVGAQGYGFLVAAPSLGAVLVGLILSFVKHLRRQGRVLLLAVAGYGMATIVFGFSQAFAITFIALVITGATDGLSAIIRNTVRQLQTPDRLRGRMTSVNQMFFMGGPQLGELEAGLVAQLLGPVFSVVSGGIGCLFAVMWIAARFPQLRRYQGHEPILAGSHST